MKNTTKKIAIILIIVMFVNCFSGCTSQQQERIGTGFTVIVVSLGVAAVIGVVGLIYTIAKGISNLSDSGSGSKDGGDEHLRRTNPYLFENGAFNTSVNSLPEEDIDSLSRIFSSMPDKKELDLFVGRLNAMSEQETVSLMESINALSEEELISMVKTVNSMQETEIVSSFEALNSLPQTVSLAALIQREADASGERENSQQHLSY